MKLFTLNIALLALLLMGCNSNHDHSEITAEELFAHENILASDSLQGREPGTEGGRSAADYIRNSFKNNELQLLNGTGFHTFKMVDGFSLGTENSATIGNSELTLGEDFSPLSITANKSLTADVIFIGYGFAINSEKNTWQDYASVDVSGKWVMMFRADPEIDSLNSIYAKYSSDRYKVMTAFDNHAAGVIFVNGETYDSKDGVSKLTYDNSMSGADIPVIQITRQRANEILKPSGERIQDLEKRLIKSHKPFSFNCNIELSATTDVKLEWIETQNVVAQVTGSKYPNNYIVIGGHYDHLGMGGSRSRKPDTVAVHNGADDNASGVSAILELADYFSKHQPENSFLFIAFSAEESGLIGSKKFVADKVIPLDSIKAMINIDMLGRYRSEKGLLIGGTGTAIESDTLLKQVDHRGYPFKLSKEGSGPSDHASFYGADIPVLFFSTGVHSDYHTPEDDIDKINFTDMTALTALIADIAKTYDTATLTFQKAGAEQNVNMRRRLKVTLGIVPDFSNTEIKGLRIDDVRPNRPADKAGLLKGDIIVAIDGKPVNNIYDYMFRLSTHKTGEIITVDVLRNEEKVVVIAEL